MEKNMEQTQIDEFADFDGQKKWHDKFMLNVHDLPEFQSITSCGISYVWARLSFSADVCSIEIVETVILFLNFLRGVTFGKNIASFH